MWPAQVLLIGTQQEVGVIGLTYFSHFRTTGSFMTLARKQTLDICR